VASLADELALARPDAAKGRLVHAIVAEVPAQAARWFLWSPVGVRRRRGALHGPAAEPAAHLLLILLAVSASRRSGCCGTKPRPLALLLLLTFFAAGASGGAVARRPGGGAVIADVPHAARRAGLGGGVASPGAVGARLLLAPESISRVAPEELPRRIRVTVDPAAVYAPGTAVRLTAILNPPPGPASPGSYDFARDSLVREHRRCRLRGAGSGPRP
jgi:competence protein ComEC